MARAAEGDARTGPYDRLLFDGRHYYTYDKVGNRTSRYRKNAHGGRVDLTTYDWDDRHRLTAVCHWGISGHCTTKVDYAHDISNWPVENSLAGADTKEEYHYDGRNIFLSEHGIQGAARKVAFVSPHCVLDFTNGAATATLDALRLLEQLGFESQAFCRSRLDAREEVLFEEILAQRKVRYEVRNTRLGRHAGRMIFTLHGTVPITLLNTASTRGGCLSEEETAALLTACELFLTENRPDVVWTYGGDSVSLMVQRLAKRLGIPILFSLHNFAYRDCEAFRAVDYAVAPSEFSRRHYRDTLGLTCQKLPLVVNPHRVLVADWRPRYLTFVNPEPRKGIRVFARIAEVLSQRRPDIPMLMVEGVAKASYLPGMGIDLRGIKNLTIMPNTPDARSFLP